MAGPREINDSQVRYCCVNGYEDVDHSTRSNDGSVAGEGYIVNDDSISQARHSVVVAVIVSENRHEVLHDSDIHDRVLEQQVAADDGVNDLVLDLEATLTDTDPLVGRVHNLKKGGVGLIF